jgi:DnaK suppressor protein
MPSAAGVNVPSDQRLHADLNRARSDLADLTAELEALADPTVVALDDEHDSEGSTIGFERARVAALAGRARRRVVDLEAALIRLGAGTYRLCSRCGADIGSERLEALPSTRVCRGCAGRRD